MHFPAAIGCGALKRISGNCRWGLCKHQRSCDRAHDAFVPSQEGDGVHDVEQLLEVAGPPDNRYWRPKWAGLDENGKDLYPDLDLGSSH